MSKEVTLVVEEMLTIRRKITLTVERGQEVDPLFRKVFCGGVTRGLKDYTLVASSGLTYFKVGEDGEAVEVDPEGEQVPGVACRECGGPCFVTAAGTAHHGEEGEIDHDADADHTAIPEEEE